MNNVIHNLPLDYLGREIRPGDYVFYYNNLYEVLEIPKRIIGPGIGQIKIILFNKAKTTRPVRKCSRETCLVDKNDVLVWQIKEQR